MTIEFILLNYLLWLVVIGCLQRRSFGVRSIVSGSLGAAFGAKSQREANRTNRQNTLDQNAIQRELYYDSRGRGGHAILPEYFGDAERRFADDAVGIYDAANAYYGTAAERFARGDTIASRYRPIFDAGTQLLADTYSGDLSTRLQNEYAPVAAATTALAKTKKQGVLQGLQERLQAIGAANAQKGFVGSGSAAQNAALRSTIGANQEAAGALAGADLQNAASLKAIRDYVLQQQFGQLMAAPQRASADAALANMPAEFVNSTYAQQMAPLNFFRIGVGSGPEQYRQPFVDPNVSGGQIAASAIGQAGNAALDYWLKQKQASQYASMFGGGSGIPEWALNGM